MIKRILLVTLTTSIFSLPVSADTYFVDDTLRVGVRAKPDKSLPSITVIQSGASVELLEKKGSYAKIRTTNGVEGWVKSAYLSSKAPSLSKLKEAKNQIAELEAKIEELKTSNAKSVTEEKQNLQSQVNTLLQEKQELQRKLSQVPVANTSATSTPITINQTLDRNLKSLDKNLVYFVLGGIVVLISMGFLVGVSWYKKQVTKRLGGLSL